jgi:hypothetical protein
MVQAYSPQPGSPTGRLGSVRVTQISESYRLSIISEELGIKKENTEEQKQKTYNSQDSHVVTHHTTN